MSTIVYPMNSETLSLRYDHFYCGWARISESLACSGDHLELAGLEELGAREEEEEGCWKVVTDNCTFVRGAPT